MSARQSDDICPPEERDGVYKIVCDAVVLEGSICWAAGSKRLGRLTRSGLATVNLTRIVLSSIYMVLYARRRLKHA